MTGNQPFVHFKRVNDSLGKGEPYSSPTLINEFITYIYIYIYLFLHGSAALVGHSLLIIQVSTSHDLYLTMHNTHNRQTSMAPAGFEPTVSANERQETSALDRAATGIGTC